MNNTEKAKDLGTILLSSGELLLPLVSDSIHPGSSVAVGMIFRGLMNLFFPGK